MSVCFVFGSSATGKSTRVMALVTYLKLMDSTFTPLMDRKGRVFGIQWPALNFGVLGGLVKAPNGGPMRWQGVDQLLGRFNGPEALMDEVAHLSQTMRVVFEGAGIFNTSRYRPAGVFEIGITEAGWDSFGYSTQDEYMSRIVFRGGHADPAGGGWRKNKYYSNLAERVKGEVVDVQFKLMYANQHKYDAPLGALAHLIPDAGLAASFCDYANACQDTFTEQFKAKPKPAAGLFDGD